jgi:hypothetical protein
MSTRIGATIVTALITGTLLQLIAQASKPASEPSVVHYTADNRLDFPSDYREWVFLSAGRGMTYGPSANPNGPPLFDNGFVNPAAYQEFVKSGRWPDKSMFVLEIRKAATEGSINRGGQFQKDLVAVEVEVKDTQKFADTDGWAYFGFGNTREPAGQVPKTQDCYSCHGKNTATEHTFVQFYPTLIDIAKTHKTFREDTGLGK